MTRDELIRQEAAKERSVSQEKAFRRGADFADNHCWVSVEDELPPLEMAVLVCNSCQPERDFWFAHRTERPDVIVDKNKFSNYGKDYTVTHWMPLPEPPAKE